MLPYSSRTSHDQRRCGREAQVLSAAGVCPGLLPSLNTPWAAYGPGCLPRARTQHPDSTRPSPHPARGRSPGTAGSSAGLPQGVGGAWLSSEGLAGEGPVHVVAGSMWGLEGHHTRPSVSCWLFQGHSHISQYASRRPPLPGTKSLLISLRCLLNTTTRSAAQNNAHLSRGLLLWVGQPGRPVQQLVLCLGFKAATKVSAESGVSSGGSAGEGAP